MRQKTLPLVMQLEKRRDELAHTLTIDAQYKGIEYPSGDYLRGMIEGLNVAVREIKRREELAERYRAAATQLRMVFGQEDNDNE